MFACSSVTKMGIFHFSLLNIILNWTYLSFDLVERQKNNYVFWALRNCNNNLYFRNNIGKYCRAQEKLSQTKQIAWWWGSQSVTEQIITHVEQEVWAHDFIIQVQECQQSRSSMCAHSFYISTWVYIRMCSVTPANSCSNLDYAFELHTNTEVKLLYFCRINILSIAVRDGDATQKNQRGLLDSQLPLLSLLHARN